jgi:citrate lyase subunit beta/citryl-CoA lyase
VRCYLVVRRSLLFTPGNVERRIRKVGELAVKPDTVILDLEDAVPPGEKGKARALLENLLPQVEFGSVEVCVRVNSLKTRDGLEDLIALLRWDKVSCVMIPKVESPTEVSIVYSVTGRNVIPLVETSKGFLRLEDIVRAEGVVGITWGISDLSFSIGSSIDALEANEFIKIMIPLVASAYGVEAYDTAYLKIDDIDGFKRSCERAKSLGYMGKLLVHPSQIEIANSVFSPSEREVEWARKVVSAFEDAMRRGLGAIRVDDQLVDLVHYKKAKAILEGSRRVY